MNHSVLLFMHMIANYLLISINLQFITCMHTYILFRWVILRWKRV